MPTSEKKIKSSQENAKRARAKLAVLLKKAKMVKDEEMNEQVDAEMKKLDATPSNENASEPVVLDPDVASESESESDSDSLTCSDASDSDESDKADKASKSKSKSKPQRASKNTHAKVKMSAKEKRNPELLIKSLIEDEFKKLNGNLSRTVASHQTNLARARVQQFLRTN